MKAKILALLPVVLILGLAPGGSRARAHVSLVAATPEPSAAASAPNMGSLSHSVSVVFANASLSDALKSLSEQTGMTIEIDKSVDQAALPPLSVVARHTPAYTLLQQMATVEGLSVRPSTQGLVFYGFATGAQPAAEDNPSPPVSGPVPIPGVYSVPVGPGAGQAAPQQAIQALLQYVTQYAAAPAGRMPRPEQIFSDLATRAGALRYVAVVTEVLADYSAAAAHDARQIPAMSRMRSLLGDAELRYENACKRERLSAEIQLLTQSILHSPNSLLNEILEKRQHELDQLGR